MKKMLIKITYDDAKVFVCGASLYVILLLIAAYFNAKGINVLSIILNGVKIILGLYVSFLIVRQWIRLLPITRISFFAFNTMVTSASSYSILYSVNHLCSHSYIFDFSYTFITITLYLGQLSLLWKVSDGKRYD